MGRIYGFSDILERLSNLCYEYELLITPQELYQILAENGGIHVAMPECEAYTTTKDLQEIADIYVDVDINALM